MAGGDNIKFKTGIEAYLKNRVLMTGFLTRQVPAPPFLAQGGSFSFDLSPVNKMGGAVSAGYTKVLPAPAAPGGDPPLFATWVPQGGNGLLLANPAGGGGGASLVLTAELTGCTVVIDRTPGGIRIYHVQPGNMAAEYDMVRNATDNQLDILGPDDYDSGNYNVNVAIYFEGGSWRMTYQRWKGAFINQLAGAYVDNFSHQDTTTRTIAV